MSVIRLPWPPATLSPNNRSHWAVKAKATARARKDAFYAAKEAKAVAPASGEIWLQVTAFPPHNRAYDRDGLQSRLKASFDGLADALGVDDVRFRHHPIELGPRKHGGEVSIRIMGAK